MAKTQIDEKLYIMPELRRYDLLAMELINREAHSIEVREGVIEALPKIDVIKEGEKCVICLEEFVDKVNNPALKMVCGQSSELSLYHKKCLK